MSFDREPERDAAGSRSGITAAPPRPRGGTQALDRLIARVQARLSRLVWLHGLGTIAAAAAAWLLYAFLADWTMHLPAAIRVFHLLVLLALPAWLAVRVLARPLRARPDAAGTAVLIERAHPGQAELLVSAVELGRSARPSGAPELVEGVLGAAERRAATLDPGPVLDPRAPRRRFALGAAASAACAFVMLANPEAASIFLLRIAGGSTPWPQRTHLSIELPGASVVDGARAAEGASGAGTQAEASGGVLDVRIARGSDVSVLVRARGEVPEEVTLHFEGGHKSVLASAGGPVFRTLLRSVQEDTEFWVTGGDDEDQEPRARLFVLQPPDIAGLAVEIEPPAYSGLPARLEFDRDVEVLAGSRVVVHVLPDPSDARGVARLLPEDRVVELAPAPYPAPRSDEPDAVPGAPRTGLAFELRAERSLRYRFELSDASGLANPDPGLFGIAVVLDQAPEVEVLSPGRGDFDTVLGGTISLRVRADDDFGLTRLAWSARAGGAGEEDAGLAWRELAYEPIPDTPLETGAAEARPRGPERRSTVTRASVIARERIEVQDLAGGEPVSEGQPFEIVVVAADDREPAAGEGRSTPVRVRVVSADEFLRRMQDRLTRAQGAASALAVLSRAKLRETLELLAALESDAPGLDPGTGGDGAGASTASEVGAALTGVRRVQGDARALSRDLAGLAEAVLYARIDERAGAVLERLDQLLAASTTRAFDPEPWRAVAAEKRQGGLGTSGLAGKLVDIVGLALEIGEDHAGAAAEALARAQEELELASVRTDLASAAEHQKKALARIDQLLEMLAEWDNFQSVLSLTRDILQGQKNLSERTRALEKER